MPLPRHGDDGAGAQEEQAFEQKVVEDMQQGPGFRRRSGAAEAEDDEADMGDRGIGQHPFDIRLGEGHAGAEEPADEPQGQQQLPDSRDVQAGSQPQQDEEPGFDHQAAEQRRHRGRGGGMGQGQPAVDRHQGRLQAKGRQDQHHGPAVGRSACRPRQGGAQQAEVHGSRLHIDHHQPQEEQQHGQAVVKQVVKPRLDGQAVLLVGDEDAAGDADQFDEDKHGKQVVDQEQGQQRPLQHRQEEEELMVAAAAPPHIQIDIPESQHRHEGEQDADPVHPEFDAGPKVPPPRHEAYRLTGPQNRQALHQQQGP